MNRIRILANDFGPHHGFTEFDWKSPEVYTLNSWEKEYGYNGHAQYMLDLHVLMQPNTIFIGERFLFLKENQTKDKIDYSACEYIGVAKAYCQRNQVPMEWQNASQACGASAFWGDGPGGNNKIKKLGLWQPGKKHAMDSLRHLLYYVSFEIGDDFFIRRLK